MIKVTPSKETHLYSQKYDLMTMCFRIFIDELKINSSKLCMSLNSPIIDLFGDGKFYATNTNIRPTDDEVS